MSIFRPVKYAKPMHNGICANSCHKLAICRSENSYKSAIAFPDWPLVLLIFSVRNVSQVANGVVRAVAVYVVDLLFRPLSCHVEPR